MGHAPIWGSKCSPIRDATQRNPVPRSLVFNTGTDLFSTTLKGQKKFCGPLSKKCVTKLFEISWKIEELIKKLPAFYRN